MTIEEEANVSTNYSGDNCSWRQDYLLREANLISHWKAAGFFVEADLNDINCYWLQFEPPPVIFHMALAVLFIVVFFIGSVSNGLVIYVTTTSRHLWTPVNVIIANLAFSDFLMLTCLLLFVYNSMVQGPALGYQGCVVYGFVSGIAGCVSIMSLAAVAIDRCLVITCPDTRGNDDHQKKSLMRSYCTVVHIWLYSGVIASMPLFGVGKYVPEGYLTSCSFDYLSDDSTTRIFILVFFVMAWVVPIFIILASYSAVLRFVGRNSNISFGKRVIEVMSGGASTEEQMNQRRQHGHRKRRKKAKFEIRIAKTSATLVVLWFVAWTPYAIVALLGISGYHSFLTPGLAMLPAFFAKTSASVNPFIYSLNHPKIRKEIGRRLFCCYRQSLSVPHNTSTSGNSSGHGNSRVRPPGKRGDSPILLFRSRVTVSNQQHTDGSPKHSNAIHQYRSLQHMPNQNHCNFSATCSIELRDLRRTNSSSVDNTRRIKPTGAGIRRVRLTQSETSTICADPYPQPRRTHQSYKRTLKSDNCEDEQEQNYSLVQQPITEHLESIV